MVSYLSGGGFQGDWRVVYLFFEREREEREAISPGWKVKKSERRLPPSCRDFMLCEVSMPMRWRDCGDYSCTFKALWFHPSRKDRSYEEAMWCQERKSYEAIYLSYTAVVSLLGWN